MKKLQYIMLALLASVAMSSMAADQAVLDNYNKSCVVCHSTGAAGAPKTGVAADWDPRLAKGMDVLLNSALNGVNAMPAKGMCFDCSDDQMKALIEYMSTAK